MIPSLSSKYLWFTVDTHVSSTNKINCYMYDISEILLKVMLNTRVDQLIISLPIELESQTNILNFIQLTLYFYHIE